MTKIKRIDTVTAERYMSLINYDALEREAMNYALAMSAYIWVGLIDGGLACIWGLIPPTLLSNQAYLWLNTADLIKGHQFLLVRHSQLVMEEMLEEYPSICGHAIIGNDKAIRWLKWLGATFSEPQGRGLPFRIVKHG